MEGNCTARGSHPDLGTQVASAQDARGFATSRTWSGQRKFPDPQRGSGPRGPSAAALGRRGGGVSSLWLGLGGPAGSRPPGGWAWSESPARRRPGVKLPSPRAAAGPVRRRGGEGGALGSVFHSMHSLSLEDLISKYPGEQRGQVCTKFRLLCCVAGRKKTPKNQNLPFLSLSLFFSRDFLCIPLILFLIVAVEALM